MKITNLALVLSVAATSLPTLLAQTRGGASNKKRLGNNEERFLAEDDTVTMMNVPPSDGEIRTRYIVKFKDGHKLKNVIMTKGGGRAGKFVTTLEKDNAEVMILEGDEDKKIWEDSDDVEFVEEDSKVFPLQSEEVPYGITMVRAAEVDTSKVSNRKVCIIDTGYDKGHPDLQTANVSGYSGPESAGPWDEDRNGHGTHVAGTIAALGGNNEGVVGVVPTGQMNLYIVRVFGNNGRFTWKSTLIAAVEKCVEAGSNIVSMSLGGPIASILEATAYKRMTEEDGVLLIAAAGNGGNSGFSYPASYESVMSVGAVDSTETIASFSQYNTQVDISAPGVDVRSTTPGGEYRSYSGTSMATPHVAGVAALVWSHFPNLKGEQIRVALEENAVDKGADGYDEYYGHGLVDAKSAYDSLASGKVPSVCTDSRAE